MDRVVQNLLQIQTTMRLVATVHMVQVVEVGVEDGMMVKVVTEGVVQ